MLIVMFFSVINVFTINMGFVQAAAPTLAVATNVNVSATGLNYSNTSGSDATTYVWSVSTGWSFTAKQDTKAISQNGNISTKPGFLKGTRALSSKAVSIGASDPHGTVCSQCHINHTSPGGQLTAVLGNANLCISCHNPAGSASPKPFANDDKAVPGTSGTSHAWDKNAVNATFQTNAPTNAAMLARINSGQIICSTCHNQHSQTYSPYLRADNTGDALCKDCHSARNLGTYASNPASNRSSHPVGITYNGTNPGYLAEPTAPIVLTNSKVECSSCHKTHYAASTDGNLLRKTNDVAICTSCHVSMTHHNATCNSCHQTHNTNKSNIYLIRDIIATPNSGNKTVVFTAESGTGSFADGASPYNGVCEVCHTNPASSGYHLNNSPGTHNNSTNCTDCHKHANSFRASCFDCHNTTQGTRRQIVDNTGNGLGTGGDFKRTSHHVTGSVPKESDCILCHDMTAHKGGTVRLKDDLGTVYSYNPANKSTVEGFCLNCHDANGFGGDVTPLSDGVAVPVISSAMWTASAHKTTGTANANTCLACHDNGHGSNKSTLIGPYTYAGPGTGTDLMNEEEGFCLGCHGGTGVASVKVHLSFANNSNTATAIRKHDPTASYRKHTNDENTGSAFGGANRHVECGDCHNPHGAKVYAATTAPAIYNELIGASGVTPTYAGAGAPTGFTFKENTTYEYEVCFKCHSSYTTLPTYLPAGWTGTADQPDALRKLTTGGTNTQIADSRDMAQEYNPANASYHPVMAAGTNLNINAATFQTGYTFTSRIYCSSCHDNNQKATAGYGRGPHGSQNLHILDAGTGGNSGYKTTHTGSAPATTDFCTKCHKAGSYISGNTSSRFGYHLYHVANKTQEGCYLCHDTHGSEVLHLMNFSRNQSPTICITSVGTNTQAAFAHANGTAANTCTVTCHGTSHGSGKSYNPAYN
jgi:predicted CXXCH cytochrome family protein